MQPPIRCFRRIQDAFDREVQGLVEGIRDHWRRWPELGWAASSQGVPVEELPAHAAWREEGAALLEAGRSLMEADCGAAIRMRQQRQSG